MPRCRCRAAFFHFSLSVLFPCYPALRRLTYHRPSVFHARDSPQVRARERGELTRNDYVKSLLSKFQEDEPPIIEDRTVLAYDTVSTTRRTSLQPITRSFYLLDAHPFVVVLASACLCMLLIAIAVCHLNQPIYQTGGRQRADGQGAARVGSWPGQGAPREQGPSRTEEEGRSTRAGSVCLVVVDASIEPRTSLILEVPPEIATLNAGDVRFPYFL